jgi:hypothetical protein
MFCCYVYIGATLQVTEYGGSWALHYGLWQNLSFRKPMLSQFDMEE